MRSWSRRGKVDAKRKIEVAASQVPKGPLFDAFGFYTPLMTKSSAAPTMDVYADDLLYGGSASTR